MGVDPRKIEEGVVASAVGGDELTIGFRVVGKLEGGDGGEAALVGELFLG